MTTASPEDSALHRHREQRRDDLVNGDVRPGTGENSTVSPAALTAIAQSGPGARSGPEGVSRDLAQSFKAAALPPVMPGPTVAGGNDGARPQGSQRDTGKGISGPAR